LYFNILRFSLATKSDFATYSVPEKRLAAQFAGRE